MSDNTGIEWTDATWQTITAAKRIGVSPEEYIERRKAGEKWCSHCKAWHLDSAFGKDSARGDGLSASCLASKRVIERKPRKGRPGRRGFQAPTRDGDKKQARRRINYLVEQGLIPRPDDFPCFDCADAVFSGAYRHEYDHAKGYDGENQLYVEPVCSKCHRNREEARRGQAA